MARVKCFTVIEITDNCPVGVHVLPPGDIDDVVDLVCDLWQEQELVPLSSSEVYAELQSKGCFDKINHHADYGIHVQKNTKE